MADSIDIKGVAPLTPEARAELRALESDILLARAQFARQVGITFDGDRDLFAVLGYDRQITASQYRERYYRGGIAARVVDAFPNATWRGAVELIENENPETDTAFEQAWRDLDKRLQIQAKLLRVDKLSQLSTYAVLLIGAPGKLEEELPKGKPDQLVYLQPFLGGGGPNTGNDSRSSTAVDADCNVMEYDTDATSERFGMPKTYQLRRTNFSTPDFLRPVHWSRIIHIAEGVLDDEVFGLPALERVWNLLDDLDKVTGGGAEAFWLRANQGLHLDIDKDMALEDANNAVAALREQSESYKHQLTRWLRTRGVSIQTLGSDVANFANPADAVLTQIAGAKAIPKRILTGSEMGELASSQDRDNWKDQINGRQTGYAGPYIVRPLVDRLISYGYFPTPQKGPLEYEVRWPHIEVLTETEKADGAAKWAGVNATQGEVVFTDAEIRDKWYGMEPLTDEQRQEIADRKAEALAQQQAAMMPADEVIDEEDPLENFDVDEVEDDVKAAASWQESQHQRGKSGQFGGFGSGFGVQPHPQHPTKIAKQVKEKKIKQARVSYKKKLTDIHENLPDDEKAALAKGYKESGYKGSELSFLQKQLELYQTADEGDPRLKTWFSGATIDKYKAIRKAPKAPKAPKAKAGPSERRTPEEQDDDRRSLEENLKAAVAIAEAHLKAAIGNPHLKVKTLGGPGSGNFGHSGRPGEGPGGSGPSAAKGSISGDLLAAISKPDGGFTYHPTTGAQPKTGYALSLHQDREQILEAKDVNVVALAQYVAKNRELLAKENNYFGAWHNPADGKVYLDVSTIVSDPAEAERLGVAAKQYAYFDLEKGVSVKVKSQRYYVPKAATATPLDWPVRGIPNPRRYHRARAAIDGTGTDSGRDRRRESDSFVRQVDSFVLQVIAALPEALKRFPLFRSAYGTEKSGNWGHSGRPGEVGGSSSEGGASRESATVRKALNATPVPVKSGSRIGGGHVNDAWRVTDKDGNDYLFKPEDGERHDIHDDVMDYDDGPGLAEREVLAAQIGQALGLEDLVPDAKLATLEDIPTPPAAESTAINPAADPEAFELRPPSEVTPTPEHSGVIQTTIGGLRADQRLDAWGRPIWFGVSSANRKGVDDRPGQPGNLVNDPKSTPAASFDMSGKEDSITQQAYDIDGNEVGSSYSGTKYDADGDPIRPSGEIPIGGSGALIKWVPDATPGHGWSEAGSEEERANLVVFDTIIGNLDRHGANYMEKSDGSIVAIDHGYSFPSADKTDNEYGDLRSFIMGGHNVDIPDPGEEWGNDMASRIEKINWEEFLKPSGLTWGEKQGVINRADLLVSSLRSPARLQRIKEAINWHR